MRAVLPRADGKSMDLRVLDAEAGGEVVQLAQGGAVGGPNQLTRLAGKHEHEPIVGQEDPERQAQRAAHHEERQRPCPLECRHGFCLSVDKLQKHPEAFPVPSKPTPAPGSDPSDESKWKDGLNLAQFLVSDPWM